MTQRQYLALWITMDVVDPVIQWLISRLSDSYHMSEA